LYDLSACSTCGIVGLAQPARSTRAYGLLSPTCASNLLYKYYKQREIRTLMVRANCISRRRSAVCVALALYPASTGRLSLLRRSPAVQLRPVPPASNRSSLLAMCVRPAADQQSASPSRCIRLLQDPCPCSGDHLRCSSAQRRLRPTGPLCGPCASVLSSTGLKRVVVALSSLLLRVLLVD